MAVLCFNLSFLARRYDGDALKQAGCFWAGPEVGEVNHPFSSHVAWAWWSVVKRWAGEDFVARMAWLEAINALLGAASVGLGVAVMRHLGLGAWACAIGGLVLGTSHAWMYHSLQATEPMLAQFWLMASAWLAVRWNDSSRGAALSGVAWALSVASYQSYFLAGPAVLLLAVCRLRPAIVWTASAGLVGTGLFSLAAYLSGAKDLEGILRYLHNKPDGAYWGFFSASRMMRVPLGLVQAIANPWPLRNWPGLLEGYRKIGPASRVVMALQMLATAAFAAWALAAPVRPRHRRVRGALLLGFACSLFPPFYLIPLYNKLWILPVSFLVLLAVLAADRSRRGLGILAAVLALQLAANVPRVAVAGRDARAPGLLAASAIREVVGPEDLLICDGWDDSGTFCAMYPKQPKVILMFHHGGMAELVARVKAAHDAGHRVFVYGLVEWTPEFWGLADLGSRPGLLRHEEFEPLRRRARPVWRGKDRGVSSDLHEVSP